MAKTVYALYSHKEMIGNKFTVPFAIYDTEKQAIAEANEYALANNDAYTIFKHTLYTNDPREYGWYKYVTVRMSYNYDNGEFNVLSTKLSREEKKRAEQVSDDDPSIVLARMSIEYDDEKDTYDDIIEKAKKYMENNILIKMKS